MSHFTTAEKVRKLPTARHQRGLFAEPPAPAASVPSPAPAPSRVQPAPPRSTGIPRVRACGQLFDLRIVDDPGNPLCEPSRIFDFVPPDRPWEVAYRVTDHERSGPRCWCSGLPRRACPHVLILIEGGYILDPDDLDVPGAIALGPDSEGGA